jgi:hypothetical protein
MLPPSSRNWRPARSQNAGCASSGLRSSRPYSAYPALIAICSPNESPGWIVAESSAFEVRASDAN